MPATDNSDFEAYVREITPLLTILGRKPPLPEEKTKGDEITAAAPSGAQPVDVARYFEAIVEVNRDGERYNAEWRVRANPVIVHFFTATRTTPDGDITPWCAAFLNFCLRRGGHQGTGSASSGSFRCVGREATAPAAGDVAVFAKRGHDEPCEGKGHVAFYVSATDTHVRVLGGNQSNRVQVSDYARTGDPRFLSIRDLSSIP